VGVEPKTIIDIIAVTHNGYTTRSTHIERQTDPFYFNCVRIGISAATTF